MLLIIGGLALALMFCYNRWQAAVEEGGACRATVETMVTTAAFNAEQAEKRVESWRLANDAIKERGKRERTELLVKLDRMRGAPTRPDGTAIPTAACSGPGTDGVPEKFVSITEYESLQSRAAADAQDWVRLQDYVINVCLKEK